MQWHDHNHKISQYEYRYWVRVIRIRSILWMHQCGYVTKQANKAFAKSAETAKRVLDKLKNPFAKMGSKAYGNKNSGQTNNDAKGSENTPPPAGQASAGGSWWKKGGWFNKKGGMFSDLKKKVAEQADKFKNARGDGALVIPLSPWSC